MRPEDLAELDVEAPEFRADPLAAFDALRPAWAARSGRGIEIFGYRAVEAVYRGHDFAAGVTKLMADMGIDGASMTGGGATLQGNDGPDHDRLRRIVSRWFTPKSVAELAPRVERLTTSLLEPLTDAGGGELMADVARRIPGPVFCWMIGAPEELGDRVFALSEVLLLSFEGDASAADAILDAAVQMRELVDGLIAEKRRDPGDDLLTVLLAAEGNGELSIDDVHSLMFEMLGASTDNTAHSAGLAAVVLGKNPDQWRALQEQPDLVANGIEECARVDPRIRCDSAWARNGGELLGLEIPVDEMVWQHTAAAHVDPEVFPDPYRVDVTRKLPDGQLNFGVGRHFCLGAALARMELRTICAGMLEQWADFELDGEPDVDRSGASAAVRALRFSCTRR